MANVSSGFGIRPARPANGGAPNYQLTPAVIAYNNANTIAKWDPIIITSAGTIDKWTSGAIYGIFFGCEYLDPSIGYVDWKNTWTAPTLASGTVVTSYIMTDREMIFEVAGPVGTNTAQASVGMNVGIANVGTPSPNNARGYSTARLTGIATTNTLPLTITGLSQLIGNDNTAINNIVEVKFNNTFWVAGVTGV